MIKKFKIWNSLFERTDIEKSQIIRRSSEIILNKIKNHIDMLNKIKNDFDKFQFNLSENFICRIKNYYGNGVASYSFDPKSDNKTRYLNVYNQQLFNYIHNGFYLNKKISEININWTDILNNIYHEITHRYDDLKHDLKRINKSLLSKDNFNDEYRKCHTKNSSEYNAYFLAAINYLKSDLENGQYTIPNNFTDFKADFEQYIGTNQADIENYNFYKQSEKFRKHFNKRIYDLWMKIKENGVKILFEDVNSFDSTFDSDPEIGDYVICDDYGTLKSFLLNSMGKIVYVLPDSEVYVVEYYCIPEEIKYRFNTYNDKHNCRYFSKEKIKYWSKDKQDLQKILDAQKFGL